jgi:transketolase
MENKITDLKNIARQLRLNTFKAITNAGGGHYGGSLSVIEIIAVLYFDIMRINPKNPDDDARDRFVLSKGHAGPVLYTALAMRGYFPLDDLKYLDKPLSSFPKHVDRLKLKGIDASTGSLGQGLSIACGMAISLKQQKKDNLVYVVLGDGELDSGQTWEAAMAASKYGLDNIIAIIDRNQVQIDGSTEEIMPIEPLKDKWTAFGWRASEVDGHDVAALHSEIINAQKKSGKPNIIIAKTIKGCGISFMEGKWQWHSGTIDGSQYKSCLLELGEGE